MGEKRPSYRGQATIEYLFVLLFIIFLGGQFLKYMGIFIGNYVGGLAYWLSNHLATGVCEKSCFFNGFVNQVW